MSLETVLLLALFILLPLIERLVSSARQRNQGAAVPSDGRPASAGQTAIPEPQPPGVGPPRHPPAVPPIPANARQPVSAAVVTPVHGLAPDAGRRETSPPTARERERQRSAAAGLGSPLALRRAIVLTTILGPCRAMTPHEFPEHDGQGRLS